MNKPTIKNSSAISFLVGVIKGNMRFFCAAVFFVCIMTIFIIGRPDVFLDSRIYSAVFVSLPLIVFMTIPMVFIIASGQIDLSFPSVFGMGAWAFAASVDAGLSPVIGLIAALLTGVACGIVNGLLVTKVGLSPLISTLGMNFLLRGIIHVGREGLLISVVHLVDTPFRNALVGSLGKLPIQMMWGILFTFIGWLLYNRHRFGGHIRFVGDNQDSSREMGIRVDRVKTLAYVYLGIGAALAGVFSTLILHTFYPSAGQGYLLLVLASVFIGGTPTWGGVGTVLGGFIGAMDIAFIETGVIALGFTGFWTQVFFGLIIILSLIMHRGYKRAKY
ncbi:D-allose transport system permease protein AlsC [subsurface metagenome]